MSLQTQASTVHFRASSDVAASSLAFGELPSLTGRSFVGGWFAVDPAKIAEFDSATYLTESPNPLDIELYPERMIEGFHLLSLLDRLMNAILYLEGDQAFGWNYGFDRVRFVSPIRAGDRMRLTGTVAEVRAKDSGYLVRQDCIVEVEGRDQPGFVAEWWVYWLPAAPGGTA
jgi:acyl dehydratase